MIIDADPDEVRRLISSAKNDTLSLQDKKSLEYLTTFADYLRIGVVDGTFVCAWGLVPPSLMSDAAYLWLFTSDAVKEHEFMFVRHSQMAVKEMLKVYPNIYGTAALGNLRTIRWLKWLGAEFGSPQGVMVPFVIRAREPALEQSHG